MKIFLTCTHFKCMRQDSYQFIICSKRPPTHLTTSKSLYLRLFHVLKCFFSNRQFLDGKLPPDRNSASRLAECLVFQVTPQTKSTGCQIYKLCKLLSWCTPPDSLVGELAEHIWSDTEHIARKHNFSDSLWQNDNVAVENQIMLHDLFIPISSSMLSSRTEVFIT